MTADHDDTRHDELQRQISQGTAAQIIIEASIVRIDKDAAGEAQKLAVLIHEVRGDGSKGIAERLEDVEALITINPKEAKAGRHNAVVIVALILGALLTLTGLGAWVAGFLKSN